VSGLLTAPAFADLFRPAGRPALAAALLPFLQRQRWFGGKGRAVAAVEVVDAVPLGPAAVLTVVRVDYADGRSERYAAPLRFAASEGAQGVTVPAALGGRRGVLADAMEDPAVARLLLAAALEEWRLRGGGGQVIGHRTAGAPGAGWEAPPGAAGGAGPRADPGAGADLEPHLLGTEQSNTSVRFGRRCVLKLLRRLEPGPHPDVEVGGFLTARGFRHVPALIGWLAYRAASEPPALLAVVQAYVPNRGDGWTYALRRARAGLQDEVDRAWPEEAARLGRRTAELHLALAGGTDPAFRPERFTDAEARALLGRVAALADRVLAQARLRLTDLPSSEQGPVRALLERADAVRERLHRPLPAGGVRTRIHGDYHLGQVLVTPEMPADFVLIDFEGEPARPLAERRRKDLPLRDVAGMVRSFHYAAKVALRETGRGGPAGSGAEGGGVLPEEVPARARSWAAESTRAFLDGYLRAAGRAPEDLPPILPPPGAREALLEVLVLEKAIYELGYELDHRPGWAGIPARGILDLLEGGLGGGR
jgi:trehalose synthase-fused probable maltokinase